jgi:outer membrane immunogenic protein
MVVRQTEIIVKYALKILAAAAAFAPVAAHAQDEAADFSGIRAEARATYETPTVSSVLVNNDVYKFGNSVAFGAEVGFDARVSDRVVVGPYATWEQGNTEACDGSDCIRTDTVLGAGLHLGYQVSNRGQLFGKVGYSRLSLEATDGVTTVTENGDGFEFAGGYEHNFSSNFYGRVELGYSDNGQIDGINVQRRRAGVTLGVRF